MNIYPGPRKFRYSPEQLERLWSMCIPLVQRLLSKNPRFRPEERQALSHLVSILQFRVGLLPRGIDLSSIIEKPEELLRLLTASSKSHRSELIVR